MRIYELLDPYVLQDHIDNGLVSTQKHPTQNLLIYNYTPKAQFEPHWGDGVIDYCRGLIVRNGYVGCYDIVARPFKKFHNLNTQSIPETMEENLPKDAPVVTKKMDGSLGIWYDDGSPEGAIATRGSFTSPQAQWATKFWKEVAYGKNTGHRDDWETRFYKWTPMFEIIYPDNRIVVDYKDFAGLVCIGGIFIDTGEEVPRHLLDRSFRSMLVREVQINKFGPVGKLAGLNVPNEEGFVATYKNGLKVKIKFEDYKRLHKIITGVNPRSVWECLRDSKVLVRDGLPGNFLVWLDKWNDYLLEEYERILNEAQDVYMNRPFRLPDSTERFYRADVARYFVRETKGREYLRPVLFSLFDGHDASEVIWKQLEPAGNDNRFSISGVEVEAE